MSRVPPFQPTSSNIATTPNFSAVPTSTGLARGDMVFWKNGDYQPFSAQSSTATFPLSSSVPLMSNVTGGTGGTINSNLTTTTPSGGNSAGRNVCRLSNGNIVVAGVSASTGGAFFTIYDTSFAVVVSRVTLPTTWTNANYNTVGVEALSGGGFVIFFTEAAGYFAYAIYSNAGAVVTALGRNTTGAMATSNAYGVAALSGGGFAVAGNTAGSQIFFMIFNATGTQTYSTTTIYTTSSTQVSPIVTTASSNTFCVMFLETSSQYRFVHYGPTGTQLANPTIAVTSISSYNACTATLLGNGTTVALAYPTMSNSYGVRLFNSSASTMGTETPYAAAYSGTSIVSMFLKALSSGDVFLCFSQSNSSFYAMFNSSMTPLIGPGTTANSPIYKPTSLKYTTVASVNVSSMALSMFAADFNSLLYVFYSFYAGRGEGNQSYETIELTNYNVSPIAGSSASFSGGTTSAAVGAYIPSTLTPVTVSFYPAASLSSVSSQTQFNIQGSSTLVNGAFTTSNYDVCTLTDGSFVIAFSDDSTRVVYAKIYSSTGSNIGTVTIGTAYNGTQVYNVKVAALANGKFVVAYMSGSSTATCTVVSASYVVTTSVSIPNVQLNTGGNTNYIALGSLSNDRFAFAWSTTLGGNYYYLNVYDSSCANLAAITTTTGGYPHDISGLPGGGFVLLTSSPNLYYYQETTPNTFSLISTTSPSLGSGSARRLTVNSKGHVFIYNAFNTSPGSNQSVYRFILPDRTAAAVNDFSTNDTSVGQGVIAGCELANGAFIWANTNTTNSTFYGYGQSTSLNISPQAGYTLYMRPTTGNSAVVLWRSNSAGNYLYYSVVNAPVAVTSSIVAGVTPSSSVSLTSGTYAFAGVAANTVAANGVGIIQTNGMAILNSNYSTAVAGTAFSARASNAPGINGTINGRNMVLYGIGITGTT